MKVQPQDETNPASTASRSPWPHQQPQPHAPVHPEAGYAVPHVQHVQQPGVPLPCVHVLNGQQFNPQMIRHEHMAHVMGVAAEPVQQAYLGGAMQHPPPPGYPGANHCPVPSPPAPMPSTRPIGKPENGTLFDEETLNNQRKFILKVQTRLVRHFAGAMGTQAWFTILKECASQTGRGVIEEYYEDEETLLRVNFLSLNMELSTAAELESALKDRYLCYVNEFRAQVLPGQPARLIMYFPFYQGMLNKLYSCALDVEGRLENVITTHRKRDEHLRKKLAELKLPKLCSTEPHSPIFH